MEVGRQQVMSQCNVCLTSCLLRCLHLVGFWREHSSLTIHNPMQFSGWWKEWKWCLHLFINKCPFFQLTAQFLLWNKHWNHSIFSWISLISLDIMVPGKPVFTVFFFFTFLHIKRFQAKNNYSRHEIKIIFSKFMLLILLWTIQILVLY